MKLKRELINGFIIYLGIAIYFLVIEYSGLADEFYLRILNIVIIGFGINLTIKQNHQDGITGYFTNLISGIITSMVGAILSVGSLLFYIQYKGGEEYLAKLSKGFLFGGGDLNISYYCIGLLFESMASSIIITFILMQLWKNKVETINQVD
ncbi:hypothetical protein FLAN108750_09720 [Flavobacterium antarcticum]|uniref:hypothetical protein n=1 Tax=Flavobacterium antarcticum TaxID=271155 RepID=UPI0003B5BC1B|nr:hypothetical protein [Flavobacterium antarcticum]